MNHFLSLKKASLTGSMYREDCVKQRLVPFLEEHHADGDKLACCHYANATQDLLKIHIYPVDQTPLTLLNFAQARDFGEF